MGDCHYRRHLRGAVLSVYEFALGVSRGSGEFFAPIGSIARETGYHRETVTLALKSLCVNGWFTPRGGNLESVRRGGWFRPNRYLPVLHDEWAAKHPGACAEFSVMGKSDIPVTGKSDIPVTGKPPHISSTLVSNTEQEAKGAESEVGELGPDGYSPIDGCTWKNFADRKVFPGEIEKALARYRTGSVRH